jgi:hypothetical protein
MTDVFAQALAAVIQYLGPYPILLTIVLLVLAPWGAMVWLSYKQDKRLSKVFERQDKQFADVVQMYKDNVVLCERYDHHSGEQAKITSNLQDLVILTTSTMQSLVDHIKGARSNG